MLRAKTSWEVFDDWHAAGPNADDCWRDYEQARGHGLKEALAGHAAQHVFGFDRSHLDTSDAAVLLWPAGKSCHLEFGYIIGQGKPGWIVLDGEPERYDVMLNFATRVFTNIEDLIEELKFNADIDGHDTRIGIDIRYSDGPHSPYRRQSETSAGPQEGAVLVSALPIYSGDIPRHVRGPKVRAA